MFPLRHTLILGTLIAFAACSPSPATKEETVARLMAPPTTTSTTTTTTTTMPPTTTTVTAPPTTAPRASTPPAPRTPITTACPPEIVALIHKHFDQFGLEVAEWMVGIVWRESNCRPDVISPTGCYGLTQTALPLHARLYETLGLDWRASWADPDANLAAAALLYASSGASPWRL